MKIYLAAINLKPENLIEITKKFPQVEFVYKEEDALDCEVIFATPTYAKEKNISKFPNIKWIQFTTAGFDTADIKYLLSRGIKLTNARDVYSIAIAEDIIAKILVLNRNVKKYIDNMKTGTWEPDFSDPEIHGSTIGLIGTGSIAIEFAKRIKSFETKVLGYRRSSKPQEFFDEIHTGVEGLDHILKVSDYIVLAVPLNEDTKNMIDYSKLKLMKKDALLINIARGEVVVQDDLIKALNEKLIRGAGLDVFVPEPLPKDNQLWKMNNVYITPHCSASSTKFIPRLVEVIEDNLSKYIANEDLINIVRE
jgi:phosphoglycerate dehydrogenase-like enzyme